MTYDVERAGSRDFFEINRVLEKYANRIKRKYVKAKMSPMKKAKAIAKGVAKTLSYKTGRTQENTLKYLKKKKGDCSVYANLYYAACRTCGLDCQYVHVDTSEGPHVSNRVRIGKKWYYTDTTWYDETHKGKYIMSGRLWSSHRLSYYEKPEAYSTLNYLR